MKEITSAQFDSEVMASTVPVLVDFFTEQCGPCRQMAPILAEIERERGAALKVVKIDAAADAQFTATFRVAAVPTFLLFHRGQRLAQIAGARSKREMIKWLDDNAPAAPQPE